MDKLLVKIENDSDFMNIVGDILENKMVQQMKNYRQHYETTCFEHCLIASYFCYLYCKKHNLDYALDVYPFYGSDADAALDAGYDLRHGLIGAGVYASHGYERSHIDGVKNTYELVKAYITE